MNHPAKQFNRKQLTVLAIESSCDETAVALLRGKGDVLSFLSSSVASQAKIHRRYGGVVPEIAARNHIAAIIPLVKKTLAHNVPDIIAVTAGPGLITSLLVGVHTARALSYIYKKPLVRVNHIEGHMYSSRLQPTRGASNFKLQISTMQFPALALIVSGGHTELILIKNHGNYKKIGATLDDAAGEAFDKAAKIMDLGYPGGPAIAHRATYGDPLISPLPMPMLGSGDYSFSFSGLKTAILYRVRDLKEQGRYTDEMRDHLCAAFQHSVVTVLVKKTCSAAERYKVKTVLLAGGVAANLALRQKLAETMLRQPRSIPVRIAPLPYCTDNAAMIAVAGYFRAQRNKFSSPLSCDADPAWEL